MAVIMDANDKKELERKLKFYQDFPKEGIKFFDIFSILSQPQDFNILNAVLENEIKEAGVVPDVIVGLDARGFLFGPILALAFKVPFVPIRKKGKLPGQVRAVNYSLEYGNDSLEIQKDSIGPGNKVVIVDDLLATGGTMKAAADLVDSLGANVALCLVCIELVGLNARQKLTYKVASAMKC